MKGRKRKTGHREPNGRLQRTAEHSADGAFARSKRIRKFVADMLKKHEKDPAINYPLGRLHVIGELNGDTGKPVVDRDIGDARFMAGAAWAALTVQHSRIMGLPRINCKAINMERMGGDDNDPVDPGEAERIKSAKRLQDHAIDKAHPRAMRTMRECLLSDHEPDSLDVLKLALDALAELRNQKRRAA